VLGVHPLPVRIVLGQIDEVEHYHPAGQAERGLHRVSQPPPRRLLHRQPVHHHLDGVLLVFLQRRQVPGRGLVQPHDYPVHPRPGIALDLELTQQFGVLALAPAHHGRKHLEPGALVHFKQPVHDLLRGLPGDRPPADRAVRLAHPRVQQPQVVVDLGDRADGGPWVTAGRLLVDGHRRREPVDEVHIRLVHLAEELAGVSRQRLDVAPLALGEDGVEGQAGLAGPGQAGEHDQGIPGQVKRHVLEVVLAGTTYHETIGHCVLLSGLSSPAGAALRLARRTRHGIRDH